MSNGIILGNTIERPMIQLAKERKRLMEKEGIFDKDKDGDIDLHDASLIGETQKYKRVNRQVLNALIEEAPIYDCAHEEKLNIHSDYREILNYYLWLLQEMKVKVKCTKGSIKNTIFGILDYPFATAQNLTFRMVDRVVAKYNEKPRAAEIYLAPEGKIVGKVEGINSENRDLYGVLVSLVSSKEEKVYRDEARLEPNGDLVLNLAFLGRSLPYEFKLRVVVLGKWQSVDLYESYYNMMRERETLLSLLDDYRPYSITFSSTNKHRVWYSPEEKKDYASLDEYLASIKEPNFVVSNAIDLSGPRK